MMLSRWIMTGTSSPRLSRMNQGSLCSLWGRLTSLSSQARPFSAITSRTCRRQGQSGGKAGGHRGHSARVGEACRKGGQRSHTRGDTCLQPILGHLGRGLWLRVTCLGVGEKRSPRLIHRAVLPGDHGAIVSGWSSSCADVGRLPKPLGPNGSINSSTFVSSTQMVLNSYLLLP